MLITRASKAKGSAQIFFVSAWMLLPGCSAGDEQFTQAPPPQEQRRPGVDEPIGAVDNEAARSGLDTTELHEPGVQHHHVASGSDFTLAIRQDGTLWAWGYNVYGQLGDGTTTNRLTPFRVSGVSNVVSVAAGSYHSLALSADGRVYAWGYNGNSQLGDGTTSNRLSPTLIMTDATAIAASSTFSLALKSNGTVWAWGYNSAGLGKPSTYETKPVLVAKLSSIIAIGAGYNHMMALKSDGTAWTWGSNYYGQLGTGTKMDENVPAIVAGLTGVKAIASGAYHSVALKANGSVLTWGYNGSGQIGDNTATDRVLPTPAIGVDNATSIAAGFYHTLAVRSDRSVLGWGYGAYGQLGNGTTVDRWTPTAVSSLTGVEEVAGGYIHSTALLVSGGGIRSWGYNYYGNLGNGLTATSSVPVTTLALSGENTVSAGDAHTVAVKWDGTVWGWGVNDQSQLGDGSTVRRVTPAQVQTSAVPTFLTDITAVAAGAQHTVALKSDGTVWAWGDNDYGQIGDGTITAGSVNRVFATQVKTGAASYLSGIVAVAAGKTHSLALRFDGRVFAWGGNQYGQLGLADGMLQNQAYAKQVPYLLDIVSIASGANHSLALKANGAAYAWGHGEMGQLCDTVSGVGHSSDVAIQMLNLTGTIHTAIAVGGGIGHSLVLTSDGTVFACGNNTYGQLGDGTNTDRATAVQVLGMTKAVRIAAGGYHSLAFVSDGTGAAWAWGQNTYGQLGDGSTMDENVITQIPSFLNVTSIAVGRSHSASVRPDGLIWTWGRNDQGQLGDGTLVNKLLPTQSTF